MAQDKRIRISVDTSPLRDMRQEVSNVDRSVRELGNTTSNVRIESSRREIEQDNVALQHQIDLLNQRNASSRIPQGEQDIRQRLRENIQDINQLTEQRKQEGEDPTKYNQLTEEINRLIRENENLHERLSQSSVSQQSQREREITTRRGQNIDQRDTIDRSTERTEEQTRQRIAENKEDIQELKNRLRTIDKTSPEGSSEAKNIRKEIDRLNQSNIDLSNQLRTRSVERGDRTSDNKVSSTRDVREETILKQILQNVFEINQFVSRREDDGKTRARSSQLVSPTIVSTPSSDRDNADRTTRTNKDRNQGNLGGFGRFGTGTTSVLVQSAVDAMNRYATARNDYESAAGLFGAGGSAIGGVIGSVGNALGPIGGAIGGIVGGAVSGISQLLATKWMMELEALGNAERNALVYAQTTGQSVRQTVNQGLEEGSFAARDLGIDVGEYMQRRGQLLRAAGGKVVGTTEEDVSGTREMNSLLAAQRIYGLSESSIMGLQGAFRFARVGNETLGSSSNSPSSVIRLFENTMKELKLPFAEIAATMDESLNTFNQTAKNILDRAGEFDAGKVATALSVIRSTTGLEGRQLERVQQAVTGQNISQDTVTQAILLRAAREVHPEATTYIELKASIDKMSEDIELQSRFLEMLQGLSGGNEGQLQNILKQVFPNLSNQDIVDFTKNKTTIDDLIQTLKVGRQPEVVKGNESEILYDTSVARRTVGTIEAADAAKRNERIGDGGKALERLDTINVKMDTIINLIENQIDKVLLNENDDNNKTPYYISSPLAAGTAMNAVGGNAIYNLYALIKELMKGNAR